MMSPVTSSPSTPAAELAERAIALGSAALGSSTDRNGSVSELIRLAQNDIATLEAARSILVQRLQLRSDDHAATAGLNLINAAIGAVGWPDPIAWKPKKWLLPRRFLRSK
jgi:hypothetical protein